MSTAVYFFTTLDACCLFLIVIWTSLFIFFDNSGWVLFIPDWHLAMAIYFFCTCRWVLFIPNCPLATQCGMAWTPDTGQRKSAIIPSCRLTGKVRITEVTRPPDRHKAMDTLCVPEFSCSLTLSNLKLEVPCTKGTELPSCGCARHASHHISTHTGSYCNHGRVNCHALTCLRNKVRQHGLPRGTPRTHAPPCSAPPPPHRDDGPPPIPGGRQQMTGPPAGGGGGDTTPAKPFTGAYSAEFMASHAMHTIQISRILMHNFSSTTFVRDGSTLFTMRRRALDNSQHRLLCGTDIAHNSALREHL